MKAAVISLTENGLKNSEMIAEGLGSCDRYAFEKHCGGNAVPFENLSGLVGEIFGKYEGLIFVCACGAAVRVIAPHIVSKQTDPAVIAVDEQGRFAVSLLSGHIGGANALTRKIADIIGAVPVITTATDTGGKFSPDSFAAANKLHICEMDMAKEIAAEIVNGGKIGFYSEYEHTALPEELDPDVKSIGIAVTSDEDISPFERTLHLVPKNISLGVGCKRDISPEALAEFAKRVLSENNIPLYRLCSVCTIDVKRDEAAILKFAGEKHLPLRFYTAEQLMNVKGDFSASEFVLGRVGADNVCERSAAAEGGRMIIPKRAENGMTLAAAENAVKLDFERTIL
ncbi:MAG: cobalt-precorrin 5A hydrolase [Oscillospiraceae bacterium]